MGRGAERGAGVLQSVTLPERYEPIRRIATGGMASVWCAHDHTLDRRVAVKLLAERFANDELAGRRFKREARAAARLSGHANVVTIYDVGQAGSTEPGGTERPFIVMEYLPGGTVADALRAGALDRSTARTWLRQAAAALDYAHRRGVIHRDVKSSNFLLDRDRVLHVADFGIAQLGTDDTLTTSGEVLGTAAYLAPERALGLPATEAADRYALAVVAFELLTGQRPFTGDTLTAVARQHLEEPTPRASLRDPALPAELDGVLTRGMAKRPEDRFPTALALVDAIDEALPAPVLPAAQPPRTAAAPAVLPSNLRVGSPAAGRSRGRIAAVAALVAVLAGVSIAAGQVAGGSPHRSSRNTARTVGAGRSHTSRPLVQASKPAAQPHHATTTPSTTSSTTSSTASTTTSTPTVTPPATTAGGSNAPTLEAQGHQLMVGGDYATAIPVLRQAVAAAPASSLTYAYALYDLGRSLRLAGDPRAAVPVLWRRLQIPNQTGIVRTELALALEALGRRAAQEGPQAAAGGGHAPGPRKGNKQNPGPQGD